MEKPEYIAVPTSEELVDDQEQRRKPRFKYCAFFVKGALLVVALLAISVLHQTYLTKNQSVHEYSAPYNNVPEPCMLRHNQGYTELKQFMEELEGSMGLTEGPRRHDDEHNMDSFDKKHRYEPFCKLHKLEPESTIFEFSPETYQKTKFFLNGDFNRGGHVRISKSTDENLKDIKVNITTYAGRSELRSQAEISAYESEGDYVIQVERNHPCPFPPHHGHHHHHERKQKDCLVYSVDIEFPLTMDYYESLEFHVKITQRIEGGEGINNIEFGSIKAGLGRGAIIFDGLRAKTIKLGVLSGVVMGSYQPKDRFLAASIHGATKVHIQPESEHFNVTAASTFGPATVDLPADSFAGDFGLFHFFGSAPTIKAPNPEDIHVTKLKHGVRAGYYKEPHTGSNVIISAKFHGSPSLYLN
ncbi:hypothetical protein G6F46_009030 [Rhizopus delemar]|uniref:Adhesin domain-containing protein n=3 Tax=Rhizopus TaxID=4842 RepID=I1C435_RHIO9|nr:hypothetical protein RO3G_07920 [Rhizopus delemar RA 99-880]KAG1453693.1 hypothetical protein G6F55_007998 [Rhizopus delemar]KAG1545467.1 hypothetical protein G6F51_005454 [Rhizopus arrhizus]KAG1493313.1 hypothetical protein G6F54_008666 [Rhizopus delemar]KAG1507412.1 hypothetical protein G6F53_008967 [Rhizopus delemar]|eukprot:EIE83215.1 hypothetical protein RO3G_07920 [Rhizopus delemar RA 99-880]